MGIFHRTHFAVAAEGIVAPDNLVEFLKGGLESVFLNLQKSPKRPNMAGVLTEVQPYVISVKSKMQLLTALKIAKYYELTLHPRSLEHVLGRSKEL